MVVMVVRRRKTESPLSASTSFAGGSAESVSTNCELVDDPAAGCDAIGLELPPPEQATIAGTRRAKALASVRIFEYESIGHLQRWILEKEITRLYRPEMKNL
jgi:hypothetical protein